MYPLSNVYSVSVSLFVCMRR